MRRLRELIAKTHAKAIALYARIRGLENFNRKRRRELTELERHPIPPPKPYPAHIQGCDFSNSVSNTQARSIKDSGKSFVVRYLGKPPPMGITANEVKLLHSVGLKVVLVWETTASRASEGYYAGVSDGSRALQQAHSVGMPAGRPIYYAVDFESSPGQWSAIRRYLEGVAHSTSHNQTGVYGSYGTCLATQGQAPFRWQTYAWSQGKWDASAQLRQYLNGVFIAGIEVDLDVAVSSDYGQW